ncbi:MAG: TetR/AcrR family transcriptional regulator [Solirubrobacterales bacterium]|nr:TetR/AcrR family transcriptional regulator [Solirubrobacterales bacterium]
MQNDGVDALSVRGVAAAIGTSIRAVYSLFGSKEGLLVALGRRAFELLADGIDRLPTTDDPAADLVNAGATVFRGFATNHPAMFRIAVQEEGAPEVTDPFQPTRIEALRGLEARVERVGQAGLLGGRSTAEVARQFHALCEGLAALELRGKIPAKDGNRMWHDALSALIAGYASPPSNTRQPDDSMSTEAPGRDAISESE